MSDVSREAQGRLIAEALDYYFIPGEHTDGPNLQGHAALRSLLALVEQQEKALREARRELRTFQSSSEHYFAADRILTAALSGGSDE